VKCSFNNKVTSAEKLQQVLAPQHFQWTALHEADMSNNGKTTNEMLHIMVDPVVLSYARLTSILLQTSQEAKSRYHM